MIGPMLLKACLNGARLPREHPRLPVTARALASDVRAVVAAGAGAVHLHAKDADGADTLAADVVARCVDAARSAVPDVPVGVTTGAWAAPRVADRLSAIAGWQVLPDFASVNWHEAGADEIAALLLERGIGVEAGLWTAEAVQTWLGSPHRERCLRTLLELPDGLDRAATAAASGQLLGLVADLSPPAAPVLLHGAGSSAWPALRLASTRGLDLRIGLEDVLVLPDGSPAADNAALVHAAMALVSADGVGTVDGRT